MAGVALSDGKLLPSQIIPAGAFSLRHLATSGHIRNLDVAHGNKISVSLPGVSQWLHLHTDVVQRHHNRWKCCSSVDTALYRSSCSQELYLPSKIGQQNVELTKIAPVRTLIVDNYDSYTYNLFQILSVVNGVPPMVIQNDEMSWHNLCRLIYKDRLFHNIVISPGPGSPVCAGDIGICLQLLQECHDIPILGVCMGHQALSYIHGAQVIHAPEPVHGLRSEIEHGKHPLFAGIPSGPGSGFKVVRYHSLIVDLNSLPGDLVATAWAIGEKPLGISEILGSWGSVVEAHDCLAGKYVNHLNSRALDLGMPEELAMIKGHNEIVKNYSEDVIEALDKVRLLMGVSHISRPHHGVQFHPESIATAYGRKLLENFRELTRLYWHEKSRWQPNTKVNGKTSQFMPTGSATSSGRARHNDNVGITTTKRTLKHLRLSFKKLEGLGTLCGGSDTIFAEVYGAAPCDNTFWLDSAFTEGGRSRFSFMGGKGGPLWRRITYSLSNETSDIGHEGVIDIQYADGSHEKKVLKDGFFPYFSQELELYVAETESSKELPFDFCGGFVGYLGYELKVECGARSNNHKSDLPDAAFFLVDRFIAIDHLNNDIYVTALYEELNTHMEVNGVKSCHRRVDAEAWIEKICNQIKLLEHRKAAWRSKSQIPEIDRSISNAFTSSKSRKEYIHDIQKCLGYIRDGESYEVCLTAQMHKRMELKDPFDLYLILRQTNPAPYAAWLNFGKDSPCICCSSPERFLRLDSAGMLEAKPIKGTIPRGDSHAEDEKLRCQLQQSEKDQAENLMIVDLLRNDLGRVCVPGSVHVPDLMAVESYSTVHTLVSTIRGQKKDDVSVVDCVKAAFPGGSMTGAPKLRTMEIIDSIETCARGIYSGALGFFSFNSCFDLNIVIRTLVLQNDEASIGAGGAIVILSDSEQEYEEMILKTKAPNKALHLFENLEKTSS